MKFPRNCFPSYELARKEHAGQPNSNISFLKATLVQASLSRRLQHGQVILVPHSCMMPWFPTAGRGREREKDEVLMQCSWPASTG